MEKGIYWFAQHVLRRVPIFGAHMRSHNFIDCPCDTQDIIRFLKKTTPL